jgi:hypothetical protein
MRLRLAVWVSSVTLAVCCSVKAEIVPVYFVGTNSHAAAQMALDMFAEVYPPGSSVTSYPAPIDRTKAESVVAAAIRLYMTNDFSAFVDLYDPGERPKMPLSSYAGLQAMFSNAVDITFSQFCCFGDREWIGYRFKYGGGVGMIGKNPRWVNELNYTNGSFYLSMVLDGISELVGKASAPTHGFTTPLAGSYRYVFTYPFTGGLHPLRVLFNGTAMKLRIDQNTVASDEMEAFMTNVVATYRSGDVGSSAALWSAVERDRRLQRGHLESQFFRANMRQFDLMNVYLIFKLDFGPTAVLYYQTTDHDDKPFGTQNGMHLMTLFKDTNGHYLMTEENTQQQILFDDNVRSFLSSPLFVDFIFQQIPQPLPAHK